jgi:hypothetical protein
MSDILSVIITLSHFLQRNHSQAETVFTKELIKITDYKGLQKNAEFKLFGQEKFRHLGKDLMYLGVPTCQTYCVSIKH